jgi:VWFA-related protein
MKMPIASSKSNTPRSAMMRVFLLATLAALPFATFAGPGGAQSSAGPITPTLRQSVQDSSSSSIRVKVDLVSMPVVVHNGKGDLVLDLDKKDFRVFDNGTQQQVQDFDVGSAPISAAIVVETSSRIEPLLPAIRKTGILFTQTVIGADGDAAVIGYNDQVDKLLGFTSDEDAVENAFKNLQKGTDGAKLYDALAEAVSELSKRPAARRRVIITLAEAVDTGSEDKLGQVLQDAQLANITIYSVGLSTTSAKARGPEKGGGPPAATPPGTFGLPPAPGTVQTPDSEAASAGNVDLLGLAVWTVQHVTATVRERPLEVADVATGGLYQTAIRDSSIEPAIDAIGGELHAQYTLTYRPTNAGASGYHEIKVDVSRPGIKGMKVRSRPGYYLAAAK